MSKHNTSVTGYIVPAVVLVIGIILLWASMNINNSKVTIDDGKKESYSKKKLKRRVAKAKAAKARARSATGVIEVPGCRSKAAINANIGIYTIGVVLIAWSVTSMYHISGSSITGTIGDTFLVTTMGVIVTILSLVVALSKDCKSSGATVGILGGLCTTAAGGLYLYLNFKGKGGDKGKIE